MKSAHEILVEKYGLKKLEEKVSRLMTEKSNARYAREEAFWKDLKSKCDRRYIEFKNIGCDYRAKMCLSNRAYAEETILFDALVALWEKVQHEIDEDKKEKPF